MEAKDTVMDVEKVSPRFPDYIPCAVWDVLEAQADISFKAGIREVIRYLVSDDNGLRIEMRGHKWGKQLKEWDMES